MLVKSAAKQILSSRADHSMDAAVEQVLSRFQFRCYEKRKRSMCNEFHMLVEQSDWRYIAQCEHKTVHLRWDHLTISLSPHAFRQLAGQILDASPAVCSRSTSDNVTTPKQPQPTLRLRLNTVLLEFPASDLPLLRDLLRQARALLAQDEQLAVPRVPRTPVVIQPCPQPNHFTIQQHLN